MNPFGFLSNLFSAPKPQTHYDTSNSFSNYSPGFGANTTNPGAFPLSGATPYGPARPAVLGAATSGGARPPAPPPGPNPGGGFIDTARQQADAELGSLNTQFDQSREQLLSQMGSLQSSRDQAIGDLDRQLGTIKNTVGTQKTEAQERTQGQIDQAGNTAKNTQKQNRNVLRSLGILNSSAAGELLSKPINQFDQIRGQLGQELQSRVRQLDTYLEERVAEHQSAYSKVIQQFNDLTGKIQSDLRFNDRQRSDAIRSANAALAQRIQEIQQSAQQYQQQVDQQKQQYASAFTNLSANPYDPSFDATQISNTGVTIGQDPRYGANIYDEQRKRQPSAMFVS